MRSPSALRKLRPNLDLEQAGEVTESPAAQEPQEPQEQQEELHASGVITEVNIHFLKNNWSESLLVFLISDGVIINMLCCVIKFAPAEGIHKSTFRFEDLQIKIIAKKSLSDTATF